MCGLTSIPIRRFLHGRYFNECLELHIIWHGKSRSPHLADQDPLIELDAHDEGRIFMTQFSEVLDFSTTWLRTVAWSGM